MSTNHNATEPRSAAARVLATAREGLRTLPGARAFPAASVAVSEDRERDRFGELHTIDARAEGEQNR
jgi:hypothetical protein